jgi:hypothetical protein
LARPPEKPRQNEPLAAAGRGRAGRAVAIGVGLRA